MAMGKNKGKLAVLDKKSADGGSAGGEKRKSKMESKANLESKSKIESRPRTESKPKTESKAKIESKVRIASKPKIESKARTERKAKIVSKPKIESKAKITSKTKAESKAKTGSKAKTDPKSTKASANQKERKLHEKRVTDTAFGEATDTFKKVSSAVAQEELELLCKQYPDADCELVFETPFQLITSVILSAQTTDVNVNKVTKNLFAKFPTAKALAEADLDQIKDIIRSTGYYNAKATNIQNCARKLVERFNGEVPRTIEELTSLPGVGRKTANVVLGVAYGIPGWTVDTHVQRLSNRLGLSNEEDPEKIEYALQKLFPDKDWSKYSITLIWHGRRMCFARKPNCEQCPINHQCPSSLAPVR